ncbi:MAG: iron ABC transporter permease [Bacteroidales bacterium]|nr:iron ABC transporter permease [Candidatus Minthousia equi]
MKLFWPITILLILACMLLNLTLGSVEIPFDSVVSILLGDDTQNEIWSNIIWKSRLPQTLTALVAGAGLSVCGIMMQTVFGNPLAGPSVLGTSSGASLGVAFVVLLSGSIGGVALSSLGIAAEVSLTLGAILGSLAIMGVIVYVSHRIQGQITLLIIGVMVGYVANAIIGVLKFFSIEEDIKAYVIWGLGSFSRVSGGQMVLFVTMMLVLLPLSCLFIKTLDLMLLGDSYAANLGLNIRKARTRIIVYTGVVTAVVTAYCGPIMFLGLAVPHICRGLLRTSSHRTLLPASLAFGALTALACSLIARMPGFQGALPVNSVTALIGAPVVIWVLMRRKK